MVLTALLPVAVLVGIGLPRLAAQETTAIVTFPEHAPPPVCHLTLEEARQRLLANNKLLTLAAMNITGKEYATRVVQANYFPQVNAVSFYDHFNQPLGSVVTLGKHATGPIGSLLTGGVPIERSANVLNQDSSLTTIYALQPITDLLKVRQGVTIAQADEHIAQAQLEKATRELLSGVEQLYWGLLAVQRIYAGALEGVKGAEQLASKLNTIEVRMALAEAVQGMQQAEAQMAELQEKLNFLLDLPPCTKLALEEPPMPMLPYHCADDVISLALEASPDIAEAEQNIIKARAAVRAATVDYLPNIAVVGGFANQTAADYIQNDIGYVGVVGSLSILDWGKRRNTVRERENLVGMATLKLHQTEDEVRQKTLAAYRELGEKCAALKTALELVGLWQETVKKATTPEAFANPKDLLYATKYLALAQVEYVKADLAYRTAYVKLIALIEKH